MRGDCRSRSAGSRPSRARGSKLVSLGVTPDDRHVAPFTGAWIETSLVRRSSSPGLVAPFTGAWIETTMALIASQPHLVAPFTGAWIETRFTVSPPMLCARRALHGRVDRNRGACASSTGARVAPFTGAWIETPMGSRRTGHPGGRALHGRVDRNKAGAACSATPIGRALHGRVDRNEDDMVEIPADAESRPSRARGRAPSVFRTL